ncbi:MAG: hypothetical protein FJ253_08120 [Phycisphaerae bacterium]|nr:hypothetical protein [Phycisphaerae bacterium]
MSLRSVINGAARRMVVGAGCAVGAVLPSACTAPNVEIAFYDGGSIGGPLYRAPNTYTTVAIHELDGTMASNTTIRLTDGVPVPVTKATPDFLLARGRVFLPTMTGEPGLQPVVGLTRFDPSKVYIVIVGPVPNGPYYRFDVEGGRAVRFGADWPGGFIDDEGTLMPAPVFVDASGAAHELPLDLATAQMIWGPPSRVEQVFLPPPPQAGH